MNKYHAEILDEIKRVAKSNSKPSSWHDSGTYMGTKKVIYDITNPQTYEIAKAWVHKHKDLTVVELTELLNSFFAGPSHNERSFGGKLLGYYPKLRSQLRPQLLDRWLSGAEGWGEVDSICQNIFQAKDILSDWDNWRKWLLSWSQDKNIHKRRASLVLLTGPVVYSDDRRLTDLAFANIDRLKGEKDILITKAVSWLLRSLVRRQPPLVRKYLDQNENSLPKIAVRETRNKLRYGIKNRKSLRSSDRHRSEGGLKSGRK